MKQNEMKLFVFEWWFLTCLTCAVFLIFPCLTCLTPFWRKFVSLDFVALLWVVHIFQKHERGHCFCDQVHYWVFLEFFRGAPSTCWRLAGPAIDFVKQFYWLSHPVVCSFLGEFGYHGAVDLGLAQDVWQDCISSTYFRWRIQKLPILGSAWQEQRLQWQPPDLWLFWLPWVIWWVVLVIHDFSGYIVKDVDATKSSS